MAEFSIIDTYFNRQTVTSNDGNAVDLGVGDDSALLTPHPTNNWSSVPILWLRVDISL